MIRLVAAMPTQQLQPRRSGFAPVFMSFTMSVLIPMADMAITIKNLLTFFIRAKNEMIISAGAPAIVPALIRLWNTVVMIEAQTK